jgi:hypothetical protein
VENKKLSKLKHPPVSRPWLQDFTASYLGSGNYQKYGKRQVEDQVKALHDEGIDEFLFIKTCDPLTWFQFFKNGV